MKNEFVNTANVKNFLKGMTALSMRGAREACLMVIDGKPGLGKTRALSFWACRNDCVFVRAKKEWTPNWMMKDILNKLKVTPKHSFEGMFRQAIEALGERARAAARDGSVFAVIIDEVDYISRSEKLFETIRDLSDLLEIPFILVGMDIIRHTLSSRFPQIASRVGQYIDFMPLSFEDTKLMIDSLCNIKVEEKLISFTHIVTKGYVREIKEAIASIEHFAARNPKITEVTFDMMEGQPLMNDRKNSKPIIVRA